MLLLLRKVGRKQTRVQLTTSGFLVQILSSFVQLATSGVLVEILSPYESTTVSSPGLNLSSNCQINIWIQARTGVMSLKCRYNAAFTKKSWSKANQSATNYKGFLVQILSSFVQLATSGVLVQILSPYESTTVSSPGLNLSSNCSSSMRPYSSSSLSPSSNPTSSWLIPLLESEFEAWLDSQLEFCLKS